MHLPPAVSYEVVRSRWQFFIACALAILSASAALLFWVQQGSSARAIALACAAGTCSPLPFVLWRKAPTGLLYWDGAQWLWPGFSDAPVHHMRLCLDLQSFLLVQIGLAQGETAWLFMEERDDRARWLALRRALVARGRAEVNPSHFSGTSQEVTR